MMTSEASYRQWLASHDISRPHPSGRWRIRWADIQINGGLVGHRFDVGRSIVKNPTEEDYNFLYRWQESDERRHKINLVTFLKTAFAARHQIEGGRAKALKAASFVRQALVAFAEGNEVDGIEANLQAWCQYMIVRDMSHRPLIDKGLRFPPGGKKGRKCDFTLLIEQAASNAESKNFKDVISALERIEGVQEVDWESEEIWLKGEDTPRKFKTVKNKIGKL